MTSVAVLPLLARHFHLPRQSVEVDQHKTSELMGLSCLLLADACQIVNCTVADGAKFVRPVFQRVCDCAGICQLFNTHVEIQIGMLRCHLLSCDLEGAPIHGAGRFPVFPPQRFLRLNERAPDRRGYVVGRHGGFPFWNTAVKHKSIKASNVTSIATWLHARTLGEKGGCQRSEASIALEEYMPTVSAPMLRSSLCDVRETDELGVAVRTIISEGDHVYT